MAFDQALNLAIVLQTLHVDGNHANGIEIPSSIRSITSGVALDFKQRRESFASNLTLRKLVVDGRSAGLWGGVKAIRTPTLAIKSMYATLGITPVLDLLTTVETIDPNSSRLISRQTFTYDADGRQTGVRSEYDNNGVWERSTDSYFFDTNGNLSHYETDSIDDGRVDRWADITFNIKGEVPLMVSVDDTNFDGMVDSRTTLNFTYNASGKMTEMRQEDDTNNDGTIDSLSIQTSSYDNNGRNVLDVSTSNGVVTLTTQSTYDFKGQIQTIRTEQDVDRNGVMDDLTIDTYDASGQLASSEEFSDYNGVVHTRTTYAYDSSGQMIMSETDADGDGRVDSRIRSVYNAMGKRVLRERDNNADGFADFRTVFTYDGDGYMILTEDDVGADGNVDQQTTFVHVKVAG